MTVPKRKLYRIEILLLIDDTTPDFCDEHKHLEGEFVLPVTGVDFIEIGEDAEIVLMTENLLWEEK